MEHDILANILATIITAVLFLSCKKLFETFKKKSDDKHPTNIDLTKTKKTSEELLKEAAQILEVSERKLFEKAGTVTVNIKGMHNKITLVEGESHSFIVYVSGMHSTSVISHDISYKLHIICKGMHNNIKIPYSFKNKMTTNITGIHNNIKFV